MSLYKDASLAMIPSAYKDGKLYSIRPTDGSGDFTFSRGSNLAATRVDVNGLIEKGRENLFLRSNEFNLTWNTYNATITSGATDPNGGSTAWTLAKTGTYGDIGQVQSGITGVLTFSVYAKAGTLDHLQLSNSASPFMGVMFNLTNGSVASEANNISSNITSIGGDWYRLEAVVNQSAGGEWRLQPADGVGGVPNANLGNVIIYRAQLEQGLVATDYIETGASTAQAGILEDMPRLDYSGGASCPSLLLEPQRSNLVVKSEYYGDGDWSKTRCDIVTNTSETLSPEGLYNASKMTSNDASESYAQDNIALGSTSGTFSFFAKKGDLDYCHALVWDISANGRRQWFNLTTGAVGTTTNFGSGYTKVDASIEDYGNGWYRCSFSWSGGNTTSGVRINISSGDGVIGSPINSYGYFYGAQCEASASYPTSYIPTYGSSVTRSGDRGTTNMDSIINDSEGVLFLDYTANDITSAYPVDFQLQFNGTNSVNGVTIYQQGSTPSVAVRSGSTQVFYAALTTTSVGGRNKIALAYKANDFVVYQNGVKKAEDFSGAAPVSLNEIRISDGTRNFSINQALLFNTRLTNAELAALTTL